MKRIRIPEPHSWRPDSRTLFAFGVYRIPQDIDADLAARAVAESVAVEEPDEQVSEPEQSIKPERVRKGHKT